MQIRAHGTRLRKDKKYPASTEVKLRGVICGYSLRGVKYYFD